MADIVCPSCSTQYRINDSQLAKASKLRCKKCGTVFQLQDNIKTEPPSQDLEQPTLSEGTGMSAQRASELETMEFNLSNIQFNYPQTESSASEEATITHSGQARISDRSPDLNGGDMSLDFGASTESPSSDPTLNDGLIFSEAKNAKDENEGEIYDHITAPAQDDSAQGGRTDFAEFSFVSTEDDNEYESSEAPTLDFSFSAATPDASEEGDDDWNDEEDWEEEEEEGEDTFPSQEAADAGDMGLSLGKVQFGEEEEDISELRPAKEPDKISPVPPPIEAEEEFFDDDEDIIEEDLSTCCIDSLAMGLQRCELCGRDLKGKEQAVAQELQQQRRQQLREELIAGEVQVGFSEELDENQPEAHLHITEDFSDVEQALDALADGTFHHKIKKKQAKKTFAKKLKMAAGGLMMILVIIGFVFVFLLPSSHEKLQTRYEELMAPEEVDARQLVQLFLDAAIKQDLDIFHRLTIMPTMPGITSGKVLSVGEEYERSSLGVLGRSIAELEQTIINLEQENTDKTALLQEYSAKNLSPGIIEDRIAQNEKKLAALHKEFEEKDADIFKKFRRLQQELQKIEQEIVENRNLSRKYIDATDQVGKALYENSVTKQQFLAEQKGKLQLQIQQEDTKYKKLRQELEAEYLPQFSTLEERLATEKILFREATLLQDKQQSPVVVLTKELEQLTQVLLKKKEELEEAKRQFDSALTYFEAHERTQITNEQQHAEFLQVSKNVAASVKIEGNLEQQVSIVLKRYQAVLPNGTLTGKWLVEKLAT